MHLTQQKNETTSAYNARIEANHRERWTPAFEEKRRRLEEERDRIYDDPNASAGAYDAAQEAIDRHFRTHRVHQE